MQQPSPVIPIASPIITDRSDTPASTHNPISVEEAIDSFEFGPNLNIPKPVSKSVPKKTASDETDKARTATVWITQNSRRVPSSSLSSSPPATSLQFEHLRVNIRSPSGQHFSGVLDTASPLSLMSHQARSKHYSKLPMHKLEKPIPLSGIGDGPDLIHYIDAPINIPDKKKKSWTDTERIYLVDDLSCGLLLGLSFLKRNRLHIIWGKHEKNDTIRINDTSREIWATCTQRKISNRKTARVHAVEDVVVLPGEGRSIEIRHRPLPVHSDGYLLEPVAITDPRKLTYASLPNAIMDGQTQLVQFSNFGEVPVTIRKGQILGVLRQMTITDDVKTFVTSNKEKKVSAIPITSLLGDEPPEEEPEGRYPDGYPFNLPVSDPGFNIDDADIDECWNKEDRDKVRQLILHHHRLFNPRLGQFNDGIKMGVPFKPDAQLDDLVQQPYNLSKKDRESFDHIIDPLKDIGVVEDVPLGDICQAASPAFVVYRNEKPRVVVDLRRVNSKLLMHGYPLPRQDDILASMGGCSVFTIMDILKGFFQQPLEEDDKWKTTFVTPHRGLQRLTVASMGLATTPSFFQHRMETILKPYLWLFVLVYIDDIIVFSRSFHEHLKHLEAIFTVLENSGATMSLPKCHFAQRGVEALGHYVSRLGLSTTADKTEAIRNLEMPVDLKTLEAGLGLMGYYREFVPNYAIIADPLNELKTLGFKESPRSNPQRDKWAQKRTFPPKAEPPKDTASEKDRAAWQQKQDYLDSLWKKSKVAWAKLKDMLVDAVDLAFPDYGKPFYLYVDTSAKGIGASLHQIQDDGRSRPILFLSRTLTPAEKNYFAPELEALGLVWALDKCSHYVDHSKVVVITDHKSIEDAFNSKNRMPHNIRRITKWRLFLQRYAHNLEVIYRPGKIHTNADALSRLPKKVEERPHVSADPLSSMTDPVVRAYVLTRRAAHLLAEPKSKPGKTTADAQVHNGLKADHSVAEAPTSTDAIPTQGEPPHVDPSPEPSDAMDVPMPQIDISEEGGHVLGTLRLSDEWTRELIGTLERDAVFGKIYRRLCEQAERTSADQDGPDLTIHNFHLHPRSRLLYFMDENEKARLVIPQKMVPRIVHMAHDERAHVGENRVYYFLRDIVFFHHMRKSIHSHISACAVCGLNRQPRKPPYGDLKPIHTPEVPITALCMDFIVGLPESRQGHDTILLITDKTSKFMIAIPGKASYTTEDWAIRYMEQVYPIWGFPQTFISDMDSKFISDFWTALCKAAETQIRMTAAHHSAANGQAERSVQTVMIALVAATGALFNSSPWESKLPHIMFVMNTSRSVTTGQIPAVMLYGQQLRGFHSPVPGVLPENGYAYQRQVAQEEAAELVQIAQAKMKIYYDKMHTPPPKLDVDDYVYVRLAKPGQRGYHLNHQTKLTFRKTGPYRIAKKIDDLSYEIELPSWLKWNPRISIEHLVPASKEQAAAVQPAPGALTMDNEQKFIVDHIVSHARMAKPGENGKSLHYEVKWMGYDGATWEPHDALSQDVPKLVEEYRRQHHLDRRSKQTKSQ